MLRIPFAELNQNTPIENQRRLIDQQQRSRLIAQDQTMRMAYMENAVLEPNNITPHIRDYWNLRGFFPEITIQDRVRILEQNNQIPLIPRPAMFDE
jgi:hypothetical protein